MMRSFRKPMLKAVSIVLVSLLSLLTGCHTVPESNRQAFIILDIQTEMSMGLEAYTQIKGETPVSNDPKYNRRVQRIGADIARVANQPDFAWEFTVFDKPDTINAWCLPGGKIGIYTGLFKLADNKHQLSFVMAHEVGHAVARHGAERMSYQLLLVAGAEAIAVAMDNETQEDQVAIERMKTVYGVGSMLFIILPFSRRDEYEADRIGIMYMADAGYDPREAIKLNKKFVAYHEEQGGGMPDYLSTHPSDEKRIAKLKEYLPEAMLRYYRATGQEPPEGFNYDPGTEDMPKVKLRSGSSTQKNRRTFTGIKLED